MSTSTAADRARLGLWDITQRRGQKITARDIASAHLAIAALDNLLEQVEQHWRVYGNTLSETVDRGIQLDAVREMLVQIKEILE